MYKMNLTQFAWIPKLKISLLLSYILAIGAVLYSVDCDSGLCIQQMGYAEYRVRK